MDFISISILVIAVLITILTVFEGADQLKVPVFKTIIAVVNLIISTVFFVIYPTMIASNEAFKDIYFYIGLGEFGLLFVFIVLLFVKLSVIKREMVLMNESIKNSPWNTYIILDKKDRIKDISDNLLADLNEVREMIIGKKFFEVLNRAIRIDLVNGKKYTNRDFEVKFEEVKTISKQGDLFKVEIYFYNFEGEVVIIQMLDQPMFSKLGYQGRFLIGEKKTDFNLLSVEKQLKQTSDDLLELQEKFIATLEVSNEGLAFEDINQQSIWLSEGLAELLGFPNNEINSDDFLKLMQPDDLQKYLAKVSQLTPGSPYFDMKLRLYNKGVYQWYEYIGKKLFFETNVMLMSSINPANSTHFMRSNIPILDELGDQNQLIVKLNQVINESKYFHLVVLSLKNLPYINEIHGRDVGNMAIGEYLKKLSNSFASEKDHLFRLTGSTFALIVDDQRKMDVIKRGANNNEHYLNMTLEYGASKLELEVFAGVSIINRDGYNENELLEAALKALKVAENPKFKGHMCYYNEL